MISRQLAVVVSAWLGMASVVMALPTFQPNVRVVALSEEQAVGAEAGVLYRSFDAPTINNLGQTAFGAGASAEVIPNYDQYGVWFENSNQVQLAEIDPYNVYVLPTISSYAFNDQSTVLIGRHDGVSVATANSNVSLAKAGDALPGEPDRTFSTFSRPTINESGTVAFAAEDTTPVNCCYDSGVWTAQNGNLTAVARVGQAVPNSPGEVFNESLTVARINVAGRLAFYDGINYGIPAVRTNVRGFFEKAATYQQQAPGLPGLEFNGLNAVVINGHQDVIFEGYLSDPSSQSSDSLWLFRNGALKLIERQGDPAPGAGAGVMFSSLSGGSSWTAASGNSGDIAFFSYLRGPGVDITSDGSVWKYHNDSLQLVAKSGTPAPGFPAGTQFSSVLPPVMNNLGQIAFQGVVRGGGDSPDAGTHVGIWAEDAAGVLRLVIRDGDTIDVDPGPGVDLRTVAGVDLAVNDFGELRATARGASDQAFALNDLGQIAFDVTFLDSSRAVIVSNLLAVPEPTGMALLIVGMLGGARTRRTREFGLKR